MTLAIYRSVQVESENAHQAKRRFSVSGVLSELDLSSSGYYDWAARKPSKRVHSHCNYMSPNDYEKLYADFQKYNMRIGI